MVSPPPQTLIPMTKNHLNTSIRRPNRRIASPWLPPKLGQREMVGKKSIYMGDAPLLTPLACRGRPLGAAVWLGVAQGQWSHVEMLGFLSIIRDDVLEIFLNFYHGTRMRYLDLSTSFMNFRLRFHLIEFKNYLLASSWSCLDVKMCEIFGLFLDTASTNTY